MSKVPLEDLVTEQETQLQKEVIQLKHGLRTNRKEAADTDFATATEDIEYLGRVKLKVRRTLKGHLSKITSLQWNCNSRQLLTAAQDGKMMLWDTYTGDKNQAIDLNTEWVMSCGYAPSGDFACCGGLDDTCTVYNLNEADDEDNAKVVRELGGHTSYISGCRFVDDATVVTASGDRTAGLWDVGTNTMTAKFVGHENDINAMALATELGTRFATASSDKTARLWDTRTPPLAVQMFEGHEMDVNGVAFFPRNEFGFATSSDDGSLRLWDTRADQLLATYFDDYTQGGSTSVDFSTSGRLLFGGYDDYTCHVWDVLLEERLGLMPAHDNRVSCVCVSPDGAGVATGGWDNVTMIWTAK